MALGSGRQDRAAASRRPPDDSETNRAAVVLYCVWHRSLLPQYRCRSRAAVNVALHAMLSLLRLARRLMEQARVTPAPPTQPRSISISSRPGESGIRRVGTACLEAPKAPYDARFQPAGSRETRRTVKSDLQRHPRCKTLLMRARQIAWVRPSS